MANYSADVVIFGSTMSGLMAAKAAAAQGRTVAVVAENTHSGGITRGGLCKMDIGGSGKTTIIGGLTKSSFFAYLDTIYGRPAGTMLDNPEPHTVTNYVVTVFQTAGITNYYGKILQSVTKSGSMITSLTAGGDTFSGQVFIDASYEGDLMRLAGVTNSYGRESLSRYWENALPNSGGSVIGYGSNIQPQNVNILDANGQRMLGANPVPRSDIAVGDAYVGNQSFNFRPCLTRTAGKKQALVAPAGYSRNDYQILLNYLNNGTSGTVITKLVTSVGGADGLFGGGLLANNTAGIEKFDCNTSALVSSNYIASGYGRAQAVWAYPMMTRAQRVALMTDVYRWIAGMIYFCQTDSALSGTALQTDANTYGLCNDEFQDNWFGQQGWPSEMYVRECRRMVGQYVMREADVRSGARVSDPVCRYNYSIDVHAAQRYTRDVNVAQWLMEGGFNAAQPADYYQVSWRSLLPQHGQADNLIVPVCISCTHIAWGALRLEPAMMMQGEAAGLAAHLALQRGVPPVSLPYAVLKSGLLAQWALL